MFDYILMAVDLSVLGFLFYWFMNRTGERRMDKAWVYPASFAAFAVFCLLVQYSRSEWVVTFSIVLMVFFMETVLYRPNGVSYFYCLVYCLGFFLCQITSVFVVQWIFTNMTALTLLRVGLERVDNMQLILLLVKWFTEFFWTYFILAIVKKDEEEENRFFSL